MNLEVSSPSAKPKDNITIGINSNPHSYVGLLGVDQSVTLLKKGNDIEADVIFDQLDEFKKVSTQALREERRRPFPPSWNRFESCNVTSF